MEIEVVDSLKADDVLVAYAPVTAKAALWGSVLSTAAKARGARGIVIEGMTRDVKQITSQTFPVFATGVSALDANGRLRVFAYRCAIECGGVLVEPGDIIFGDADGGCGDPPGCRRGDRAGSAEKSYSGAPHGRGTQKEYTAARGLCKIWRAVSRGAAMMHLQCTRSPMRMEQRDREMSGHPGEGG